MIFKQFYNESLGHAAYFVGAEATGEALVLDVRRDVDVYFDEAQRHEMRLAYAADTHQHNDYLSGICELAARAEVKLLAGGRAELAYRVRYMEDGERLRMGEIEIEVLHTPGHTPEHISLLVYDRARGTEPALLLSGGALLVDDIARPDLGGGLVAAEAAAAARASRRTLQEKILRLPDHVQVYPTHVAGSLSGGSIGSMLSTTIGYERRMNRQLRPLADEESFVANCLARSELPTVPPYWRRMRRQNMEGPPLLGMLAAPPALQPDRFERLGREEGYFIVDCRSPEAFSAHIPGALNVSSGASFPTWAGTVLPEGARTLLVVEQQEELQELYWQLLWIGYDMPSGWLAGGMKAWRTDGREITMLPQWTIYDLCRAIGRDPELCVLDVRQPAEWSAGHVPGAMHISGGEVPDRINEIPRGRRIAVICGGGYRSSVIASLLQRRGYTDVVNVLGGMTGWESAGLETQAA